MARVQEYRNIEAQLKIVQHILQVILCLGIYLGELITGVYIDLHNKFVEKLSLLGTN